MFLNQFNNINGFTAMHRGVLSCIFLDKITIFTIMPIKACLEQFILI
jgi:hypothetical protein